MREFDGLRLARVNPTEVIIGVGLLYATLAAVINVSAYYVTQVTDVSYLVIPFGKNEAEPLTAAMVAVVSFAAVAIGAVGLRLLSAMRGGTAIWTVLAIVAYGASLTTPINYAQGTSTVVSLIGMHTVVLAAALAGPLRAARKVAAVNA